MNPQVEQLCIETTLKLMRDDPLWSAKALFTMAMFIANPSDMEWAVKAHRAATDVMERSRDQIKPYIQPPPDQIIH